MCKSCTWPTQAFVPYGPKSGTDVSLKEWVQVLMLCPLTAPSQGHSMQKQFWPKSSSRSAASVHSPPPPPRKSSFPATMPVQRNKGRNAVPRRTQVPTSRTKNPASPHPRCSADFARVCDFSFLPWKTDSLRTFSHVQDLTKVVILELKIKSPKTNSGCNFQVSSVACNSQWISKESTSREWRNLEQVRSEPRYFRLVDQ